ncbi:unnamed protein product [Microthlaspi erraticum]|uniref:NYN domain-containing protein n=1 Tax=Microthlaspi erraticum TaxID=1685480 RepID=A0A6D2JW84_9BRAS|nr:unnamed protein product [Microthlaspi erraticum]
MSSLSSKFSTAETRVFWNLDVCPIPAGLSPASISANIKLALENMGYTGNMSILAYSVEKQSQEVEFESAQIKLIQQLGTRQEKVDKMYDNLLMWGIAHRSEATNVMVISDGLAPKADLVCGLVILKAQEHNILVAQPRRDTSSSTWLWESVASTWLWESLATGGSPINGQSIRPEPATPSPTCSVCSKRALRLANKRKKRRTKPCLKRPESSSSNPVPDPEDPWLFLWRGF